MEPCGRQTRVPEAAVVPLSLDSDGTQAELHRVADPAALQAIQQSVQDVIVFKVKWRSTEIKRYKDKYRKEKKVAHAPDKSFEDDNTWYADKIQEVEAQIIAERLVTELAIQMMRQGNEERMKSMSKELLNEEQRLEPERVPRYELEQPAPPSERIAELAEQQESSVTQVLAKLQRQQREKEEQLAALKQCQEEDTDGQSRDTTFVLKMDGKDQTPLREAAVRIDPELLVRAVQLLFQEYHVRLLGVDSGLSFLMETPMSQWSSVVGSQLEIRSALNRLLPDNVKQSALWRGVTRCSDGDVDVPLGRPANVLLDPITETPQRVFTCRLVADGDTGRPLITNLVNSQRQGLLVVTDCGNKAVKTVDVDLPYTVQASRVFDEEPNHLASLPDGLVAMTTEGKVIYLLRVDSEITVESRLVTARRYAGVAGSPDGTLLVSCVRFSDDPARVDIIARSGQLVRTVVDSWSMPELHLPFYLCPAADGRSLLVSDYSSNTVYRLELPTGRVVDRLTHADMRKPRQVCADPAGNVYIASYGTHCVLARSPAGEWRRLFSASEHGEKACNRPSAVCVTNTGLFVVSWVKRNDCHSVNCVVIGHRLDKN